MGLNPKITPEFPTYEYYMRRGCNYFFRSENKRMVVTMKEPNLRLKYGQKIVLDITLNS